jgi:Fe-S oxidoreductase
MVRRAGGVTTARPAPALASRAFRRSRSARELKPGRSIDESRIVVLWPDTFSNAYDPEALHQATDILQGFGFHVVIPSEWACCGRTLYDSGRLDQARKALRRLLDVLSPFVADGHPIVVLEPTCLASFRQELPQLLVDDPRAGQLASATRSLSELLLEALERDTDALPTSPKALGSLVKEDRQIAFHPHCHARALGMHDADARLLRLLGVDIDVLDSGCCGLAGSFAYKPSNVEIAETIAQEQWRPQIEMAMRTRRVVMDGFSCRLQALHTMPDMTGDTSLIRLLWERTRKDSDAL